tara:strand:+ start:3674 stop:3835 length:162 start_codon:yes stop_codon:yes gene_type:complete
MSKEDQFKIVMLVFSILMVAMLFWVTINIGKNVKDINDIKESLFKKEYLKSNN